ncbi:30S ribosomal protein S16 [Corynebacterium renale]|uniref:Small ribosomal subunit protein bS16 n=1 Tax=Corynebacterium renale TaxID=1724 RepID=A0A2A9DRE9_9CORY|nr:30S ribosomal protein S16 [Corynebacterium renale]PFG28479.1 SSU ribosomal protein S16P [Corynebacterium renale]SQI26341.1 30S ribosomal protein S16 [Corynebacterium renale]
MAVKIKLQRLGKIRTPHYRVVVMDALKPRDGKVIESIGIYQPKEEPSVIEIDSERAQYWIKVGAQPTEPVMALLKLTGDWQAAKGLEGAENKVKKAEEKPSKLDLFNAALAEANNGQSVEEFLKERQKEKEAAEAKAAKEKEAAEKAAAEEAAKAEAEAEKAEEEAPAEEAAEAEEN